MSACWSTLLAFLHAALTDRATALSAAAATRAAEAAARQEAEADRQCAREETTALRVMMERHAAKAGEARRDMEAWISKHTQLQERLAELSDAQRLAARVVELEVANSQLTDLSSKLQSALTDATAQLEGSLATAADASSRAAAAEASAEQLRAELGVSTPRPRRDMGLLSDLLSARELALVEQALIAGVWGFVCWGWEETMRVLFSTVLRLYS